MATAGIAGATSPSSVPTAEADVTRFRVGREAQLDEDLDELALEPATDDRSLWTARRAASGGAPRTSLPGALWAALQGTGGFPPS